MIEEFDCIPASATAEFCDGDLLRWAQEIECLLEQGWDVLIVNGLEDVAVGIISLMGDH